MATHQSKAQPDGEESWTYVTSKRNRHQPGRRNKAPPTANLASNKKRPSQPQVSKSSQLTLTEIKADHEKFAKQWRDSACCRKLKEILESKTSELEMSKAICFGLGSFDPDDGSWNIKRRSHVQLAAFITLVEWMEKQSAQKIRCLFQEPCLTVADTEFLVGLGYEVVTSPDGFESVSEDSLVYGIHLYRDIYAAALEKAIPAMFIGTEYDVWEGCTDTEDPTLATMKALDEVCEKVSFPDDNDFYPTFTSTTIHWRKSSPEVASDSTAAADVAPVDSVT
ncbi:hypothetical protein BX600DRAFT_517851 [Xylariales sp. PMI_506]|nr:hypothetical protein BX600DRAFT_517851 [Xylariales sp. PMI_506]